MNKKLYTSLVLLMSFSLIGIILMQGYWIYSSWQNKEEEFSLAVKRTLREVVDEIQSRELNDYVFTYQMLIDSIGTPDESNFTDVFLFLDEDQSSNLSTFFAYGILEEDYNINLPDNLSNRSSSINRALANKFSMYSLDSLLFSIKTPASSLPSRDIENPLFVRLKLPINTPLGARS